MKGSHSLKEFVRLFEAKIPVYLKVVAELRLIWSDIVGEHLASRSQIAKCEYIPKKNELGVVTGEFHRRLLILVESDAKMAIQELSHEFLEKIPKRFKIHSFRIQQITYQKLQVWKKKSSPVLPELNISPQEKRDIADQLSQIVISPNTKESLTQFLCLCRSFQNNHKEGSRYE